MTDFNDDRLMEKYKTKKQNTKQNVIHMPPSASLLLSPQSQSITSTPSNLDQQSPEQSPTPSRPVPKPHSPETSSYESQSPSHQQASSSQRVPLSQSTSLPSTPHLQAMTPIPSHFDPQSAQQTPTPSRPVPKPRKLSRHLNRDTSGSSSSASRSPPSKRPTSLQHISDQMMAEAIQKLREKHKELHRPEDDLEGKVDNLSDKLVEVHPTIYFSDFYEGRIIPNDDKYDPENRNMKLMASDKQITFLELVSNCEKHNFIALIGFPGVGKTTISKRLARALLSRNSDNVVFRFLFEEMSDSNEKINFKTFLLGDARYSLDEQEQTSAFKWIETHPDKCFFTIDGFDQVDWTIQENMKRGFYQSYDTPLTYQNLISNLCQKKFLPGCNIMFTSRPHKMFDIPKGFRPEQTYFLHDLSSDDMKTLFYDFVKCQPQPDELWKTLETNMPHLKSLCHNALMLQLYVRAVFGSLENNEHISTMTGIFNSMLKNLKLSNHAITLRNDIIIKLARLAYKATQSRTVLFSNEDLDNEGLTSEDVQAIVITMLRSNKTCPLLEENKQLYFMHQILQEYFTAFYICYQMPSEQFNLFIKDNLIISSYWFRAKSSHWSVVIEFVSGILFDQDKGNDQNKEKRDFLLSELIKLTQDVARGFYVPDYRACVISKILREANVEVIRKVANWFVGGKMRLDSIPLRKNDFLALLWLIERIPGRIHFIDLSHCQLNSDLFSLLSKTIKGMEGKIDELNIEYNHLTDVNDISEIFPKVQEKLNIANCFYDYTSLIRRGRSANLEEQQKLQQALDASENTRLEIWLGYYGEMKDWKILHHKIQKYKRPFK